MFAKYSLRRYNAGVIEKPARAGPPGPAKKPRRRRWLQFSTRAPMIVVTVAAVHCAVFLPMLREWQQRRQQEVELDELVKLITDNVVSSTSWLTINETSRDEPNYQISH